MYLVYRTIETTSRAPQFSIANYNKKFATIAVQRDKPSADWD